VPVIAPVVGSNAKVPSPACVAACCCVACANAFCSATPGAKPSALVTGVAPNGCNAPAAVVCPVKSSKYFFAPSSNIGAGCVILVIVSAIMLPVIPIFSLCRTFF